MSNIQKEKDKEKLKEAFINLQNGKPDAFNDIYNLTQKYVSYLAASVCKDSSIVDDVIQESYLTIYQKHDTIKNLDTIYSWISMVVSNKAKDALRKKNYDREWRVADNDYFDNGEESDTSVIDSLEEDNAIMLPEQAMENKETQRLLAEIINQLPENQKIAIIECEYNQLSTKEVAELYGVPENTVKTNRRRARLFIKDKVEELYKVHGTKLYAVPMAPVLYAVIRNSILETAAASMPAAVASAAGITAASATSTATGGAAGTVAEATKHGAASGAKAMAAKIGAGAVTVAVIGGAATYGLNTDAREIRNTVSQFVEACNDHDNNEITACFTDSVASTIEEYDINFGLDFNDDFNGFILGTEMENEYRNQVIDLSVRQVNVEDDTAHVLCDYTLSIDGNEETSDSGYLQLKKEDDTWKLDMTNSTLTQMVDSTLWWIDFSYTDYIRYEFNSLSYLEESDSNTTDTLEL